MFAARRCRPAPLDFNSRPETVVTSCARWTRRGSTAISKNEPAPAALGVRVLLHGIELLQIGATSALDRRPVDLESGQRLLWRRQNRTCARASPLDELA